MKTLKVSSFRERKDMKCFCGKPSDYQVELSNKDKGFVCLECLKDRLTNPEQGFIIDEEQGLWLQTFKDYNSTFIVRRIYGSKVDYSVSFYDKDNNAVAIIPRIKGEQRARKVMKALNAIGVDWLDFSTLGNTHPLYSEVKNQVFKIKEELESK